MTKKQLSKFVNQAAKKGISELKAELGFAKAELKDDVARVKWEKVYVSMLEKKLSLLKPEDK